MHICMLTYFYWPIPAGGAENQCRKLSGALVGAGHNCTVLTSRHRNAVLAQEVEKNGIRIVRSPTLESIIQQLLGSKQKQEKKIEHYSPKENTYQATSFFVKLKKRLAPWGAYIVKYGNTAVFCLGSLFFLARNRRSIDVLHVHTADWIAGIAAFAGKIFRIPVVCKGADMPVFPPLHAVPLATCYDSWRRKPHFIALTPAMQADLVQHTVPENKITVIPNGVELPPETVAVEKYEDFLYIGNFSQSAAHKGFDLLLKAWATFHQLRPSARLLLLGGGDATQWQAFAQNLGCLQSIDFLGYQKDIRPFVKKSCCLLLPSRKEGISNALLEAQSWGLPAIVSDIPGNREVVEHQQTGIIVPTEDSTALSKAMLCLYDDVTTRQAYGRAARKRIEDVFAMEKVAGQTVVLYRQLMQNEVKKCAV